MQSETSSSATPAGGRSSRRKAAKAVDYSKEQEFSDDDIFEDNLKGSDNRNRDVVRTPTPSRNRSRARSGKKNAGGAYDDENVVISYGTVAVGGDNELVNGGYSGAAVGVHGVTMRYAEKGYDPTLPLIRERYAFAPE